MSRGRAVRPPAMRQPDVGCMEEGFVGGARGSNRTTSVAFSARRSTGELLWHEVPPARRAGVDGLSQVAFSTLRALPWDVVQRRWVGIERNGAAGVSVFPFRDAWAPSWGAFLGPGPEPVPGWRSDGDGSAAVPGILPSRLQHHIHTAMRLRFHHVLIPSSRAGLISEKPLRAGSWLRSAPVRRRECCCQEGGVLVE